MARSHLVVRDSDSPHLHAVSLWTIGDDPVVARPDGLWDLVVYRRDDITTLLVTGQTTRTVCLPFAPGDQILTLSFRPGTFLPALPGPALVDRAEVFETLGRRFAFGCDWLEIPGFDSAEDLVARLETRGLLGHDELVASHFTDRPLAASPRSVQRHFQYATGLSPREFFLIDRARRAVALIETGRPLSEVATQCGYADQAHLSRSLKALMGATPSQLRPPS